MALLDVFKNIGSGISEEVKDFKSVLSRIRLTTDTTPLGANFRKYGHSFGTYDFDAFLAKARKFYRDSLESADGHFTRITMPDGRIAVDYDGTIRGIFTPKGKPLAFFRPDYLSLGYLSKAAELEDFKKGRNILFS